MRIHNPAFSRGNIEIYNVWGLVNWLIYQNPEVSVGTQVVRHQQLEHQQQQVHREGDEHGFVLKNMLKL